MLVSQYSRCQNTKLNITSHSLFFNITVCYVCCLVFRSFRTMLLFWGRFGGNTLSRYGVPSASHSCFVPKKIPILSNFDKSLVAMFPMSQHFLKSFFCHQFRFFSPNITLSVNITCFPYCELYSK